MDQKARHRTRTDLHYHTYNQAYQNPFQDAFQKTGNRPQESGQELDQVQILR